ncbi:transcription factor bHLH103-like [Diospyros lotus]|uniref:transcription factor bHLH103-like n=1 Tax=Diospyros lotus TaxID=55363 RepID=UPI00225604CE|nr:transcription factor bHLH103-like [Diospyros lotus]XP_052205471.1 transcription factor bHLH103-like [Diospyros lotus]XP_052205472.1 transcription factor bHLH103-like [Diospyros lotus]
MENVVLPSVSTQSYSYAYSDQPVSDIQPMQMDSIVSNVYGSSICTEPEVYSHFSWQKSGAFAIPPQSPIYHRPGSSTIMTTKRLDCPYLGASNLMSELSCDSITPHRPLSFCEKVSVPQCETEPIKQCIIFDNPSQARNERKRPFELGNGGLNELVNTKAARSELTTSKKKSAGFEEQWDNQVKEESREIQRQRAPVRRSQKLSQKVTALQKLVSPYGKADTASVLQEASISIKVLQDQIQKLFGTLTASNRSSNSLDLQRSKSSRVDLRSRGLCLVPISFTEKLAFDK